MKKIYALLLLLICLHSENFAQTVLGKSLSINFISNDFVTAQRIRSSSLSSVLRERRVQKFSEMQHGFALTYARGVTPHTDIAVTLGGTFGRVPLKDRTFTSDNFFLEADASGNFKMLSGPATLNPYLIAGIGASKYTNIFGAFIPLGGGMKLNVFNEALLNVQLQYRIPVTPDANAHHFQVSFGVGGILGNN